MPYILEHVEKGYLRKRANKSNTLLYTNNLQKAQLFEEAGHAQNMLTAKFKRNPKRLLDFIVKPVTIVENN